MDYKSSHMGEVSHLPKQGISLEVILIMISQEEKSDDILKKMPMPMFVFQEMFLNNVDSLNRS